MKIGIVSRFGIALSALVSSANAVNTLFTNKSANNAKAKLLSKARPVRKLGYNNYYNNNANNGNNNNNNNGNNGVALTDYVMKFVKCQYVKTFSDDMAANDEASTVLATRRFVIFRLCPVGSCNSCNYGYGEYVIDVDSYLEYVIQHAQEEQKNMCNWCQNYCYNENEYDENDYGDNAYDNYGNRFLAANNYDCSCVQECQALANMENYGYVDAINYIQCQQVYEANDGTFVYASAMCTNSGDKIKIGTFSDEDCTIPTNENVEDYLGYDDNGNNIQLSYATMSRAYTSDCLTCIEDNGNNNQNNYYDESNELCENLYDEAAKCESAHNFNNGYTNYGNYQNQAAQEQVVCKFINSLSSGTYDETGEIRVGSAKSYNSGSDTTTTGAQKFFLTVFILGTVGLAVFAAMLHQKITKGDKNPEGLAAQGGTVA